MRTVNWGVGARGDRINGGGENAKNKAEFWLRAARYEFKRIGSVSTKISELKKQFPKIVKWGGGGNNKSNGVVKVLISRNPPSPYN